jgi:hypothetical protein
MQLNAQANPQYTLGEMYFYYEDLKIKFINKKNYTTKGIGKAMEDFNSYLEQLQQKKEEATRNGKQFSLTEAQKRKINRLSEAVCSEVEDMVDDSEFSSGDKSSDKDKGGFDLFAWLK